MSLATLKRMRVLKMVVSPLSSSRIQFGWVAAVVLLIGYSQNSWPQDSGEQIFQKTCFACHTIGGGRLIGPDLAGVHEKRSQEWLVRFVISSQSMIKEGDAEAVALFEEFNRIPMPDSFLSEEQSRQVLAYIESQSSNQTATTSPTADVQAVPAEPASEEDILAGCLP